MSCQTVPFPEPDLIEISLVIGASETWVFTVKRNGALFDLNGAKGYFGAKVKLDSPDYVLRKRTLNAGGSNSEMVILNQTTSKGKAQVFINSIDSRLFRSFTVLNFDCWFVTSGGQYIPAIKAEFGRLTIKPTITRFD